MKKTLIHQLLSLIFLILCRDTKDNHAFWNRLASDEEHSLYHTIEYIKKIRKDKSISALDLIKKDVISLLIQETLDSLSTYMKKKKDYRSMYGNYITKNNDEIKKDILSEHSIIIECISEILAVRLTFFNSNNSTEFRPITCYLRNGKCISLRWNSHTNLIEEMDSSMYRRRISEKKKLISNCSVKDDSDEDEDNDNINASLPKYITSQRNNSNLSDTDSEKIHTSLDDSNKKKVKKSFVFHSYVSDEENLSDSDGEMNKKNTSIPSVKTRKRKYSEESEELTTLKQSKIPLGSEPEFDFLTQDLHLSDTDEDDSLTPEINQRKNKKDIQHTELDISDEVKELQNFIPMATLFKDEIALNRMNLQYCFTVVDRIRKHLQVLASNMLPERIDKCCRCPQHCSTAVLRCTKDRRGPRNPKGKKMKEYKK